MDRSILRAFVEAQEMPVEVHLTTHGFSAGLDEKRQEHEARKDGAPNIFVDPQALLNQVAGLRERAEKRLKLEKSK